MHGCRALRNHIYHINESRHGSELVGFQSTVQAAHRFYRGLASCRRYPKGWQPKPAVAVFKEGLSCVLTYKQSKADHRRFGPFMSALFTANFLSRHYCFHFHPCNDKYIYGQAKPFTPGLFYWMRNARIFYWKSLGCPVPPFAESKSSTMIGVHQLSSQQH